jgi:anti-sigma regulatory factor (Ser/Thr protein kinase)
MPTLRHVPPGSHTGRYQGFCASVDYVLAAEAASAAQARRHVASTLADWGLRDGTVTGDSVLVATELATNAIRAAAGDPRHAAILLRLSLDPGFVYVQAGDHSPARPPWLLLRRPSRWAEHGRGLRIARALSSRLSWYRQDGWKIVWAAIPLAAPRPRAATRHRLVRAA